MIKRSLWLLIALCAWGQSGGTPSAIANPIRAAQDSRVDASLDVSQLKRGLRVFSEVCSACHGARSLTQEKLQKIQISPGEYIYFGNANNLYPDPYLSIVESFIANNGAIPGDLTDLYKIRRDAPSYTYRILLGYGSPPNQFAKIPPNLKSNRFYNSAFENRYIAMPPPLLAEGQVTYDDGTVASVDQMARDVSIFLNWASNSQD